MPKFDKTKMHPPARRLSNIMRWLPFSDCIWLQRLVTKFRFYKSKNKHIRISKLLLSHNPHDFLDSNLIKQFSQSQLKGLGKTSCRLYNGDSNKIMPLIVYFHGGGFVYGNFNSADGGLRDMCYSTGCNILVIKYPLAPKYKCDIAIRLCNYILTNLNIDILYKGIILMGDSAGCSIVLNTIHSVLSQLQDTTNSIIGQILLYPMVEEVTKDSGNKYPSIQKYAKGCMLTKKSLIKMYKLYLPKHMTKEYFDKANPINLSFNNFPKTLIFGCEFDPLRDHAIALYNQLNQYNCNTKLINYNDITHGYFASFEKYIALSLLEIVEFFVELF
ncbi:MAG: alpha/beta hydrolase [Firmicutes bacterium]|nr:alpha/beta hydrolase [Bacillota bacterium]MCL1944951.1 alpha/beta hydrolase [Bacillota bacterium]MCL1954238.1 alpha/beta hydrolase [Bacillota bacterium]